MHTKPNFAPKARFLPDQEEINATLSMGGIRASKWWKAFAAYRPASPGLRRGTFLESLRANAPKERKAKEEAAPLAPLTAEGAKAAERFEAWKANAAEVRRKAAYAMRLYGRRKFYAAMPSEGVEPSELGRLADAFEGDIPNLQPVVSLWEDEEDAAQDAFLKALELREADRLAAEEEGREGPILFDEGRPFVTQDGRDIDFFAFARGAAANAGRQALGARAREAARIANGGNANFSAADDSLAEVRKAVRSVWQGLASEARAYVRLRFFDEGGSRTKAAAYLQGRYPSKRTAERRAADIRRTLAARLAPLAPGPEDPKPSADLDFFGKPIPKKARPTECTAVAAMGARLARRKAKARR